MSKPLPSMTTSELVAEYCRQAEVWVRSQIQPDRLPKERLAANKAFERNSAVARALLSRDQGTNILLGLLASESIGVKLLAATDALFRDPDAALPVLKALCSSEHALVRFGAEMTLTEWKSGNLKDRLSQ